VQEQRTKGRALVNVVMAAVPLDQRIEANAAALQAELAKLDQDTRKPDRDAGEEVLPTRCAKAKYTIRYP
jgi:hypothetical protein